MKIVQVTPVLAYGDGVGNDIVAMDRILKQQGFDTEIYTIGTDKRLEHLTKNISKFPKLKSDDILIYHMSIGSDFDPLVKEAKCFKVMVYHNITPASFYEGYNYEAVNVCKEGLRQVKNIKDYIDFGIADSEFNKQDLLRMGYTCPIEVLPILIPFEDYQKDYDIPTYEKYMDGYTNLVFTGRIVPNKKQEDIIDIFYHYKKYWNEKSRLIFVGSYKEDEPYYQRLASYVEELGLEDVVFTGHISFASILACYKAADVFVCMSEHEGFCIPLLEAMSFEKPVIAYHCAAVPETIGKGAFVVAEKNPLEIAGAVNRIVNDENLRKTLIENQNKRLADFQSEKIEKRFLELLDTIIELSKRKQSEK